MRGLWLHVSNTCTMYKRCIQTVDLRTKEVHTRQGSVTLCGLAHVHTRFFLIGTCTKMFTAWEQRKVHTVYVTKTCVCVCMLLDLLPGYRIKPRQIYTEERSWLRLDTHLFLNKIRSKLTDLWAKNSKIYGFLRAVFTVAMGRARVQCKQRTMPMTRAPRTMPT